MDNTNMLLTELLSLLDRKKLMFDEIKKVTLEQQRDIEENDANSIEALINQKQAAIDSVDEIDSTFSEMFAQLKAQLKINNLEELELAEYPLMKSLKQKVGDIIVQAQDIMEIEEYNKVRLAAKLEEIKKEMKQLSIGKKTIQAYQNPIAYNDGIYIDKKK